MRQILLDARFVRPAHRRKSEAWMGDTLASRNAKQLSRWAGTACALDSEGSHGLVRLAPRDGSPSVVST